MRQSATKKYAMKAYRDVEDKLQVASVSVMEQPHRPVLHLQGKRLVLLQGHDLSPN